MFQRIDKFKRDDSGAILVMVALLLGLFCGLLALTFDVGRISVTHSEMQSYADHVALAAAAELDGRPDSITRATNAASAMISDYRTFGDAAAGSNHTFAASDYSLTFFTQLPTADTTAPTATTTDPEDARYVRVQVAKIETGLVFGRVFARLSNQAELNDETSAEAIAAMEQYACDVTPLMFCIPPPSSGEPIWMADNHIGEMVLLRGGGGGAAWGPGDFGFLDPDDVLVDEAGPCAGLNGAQKARCVIGASHDVTKCFSKRGVDTEPGQKVGIEDGAFNVRFDIWTGNMKQRSGNSDYAPAPNVVKGIKPKGGGSCINNNFEATTDTLPLPQDTCMQTGTCGRYGDGNWNETAYLAANHTDSVSGTVTDPRVEFPMSAPFNGTRWEMYNAEIKLADKLKTQQASNPSATTGSPLIDGLLSEAPGPQCAPAPSPKPARRVVIAAAINCDPSNGGTAINGREYGVPVQEFVKFFLTEPVSSSASKPPTLSIRAEVLGSAGGNGGGAGSPGGTFRDVVQLYR